MARVLPSGGFFEIVSDDSKVDLVTPPGSPKGDSTEAVAAPVPDADPVGDMTDAVSAPGVRLGGVLAQAAKAVPCVGGGSGSGGVIKLGGGKVVREYVFSEKLAAVAEAKAKFQLQLNEKGGFVLSKEQRFLRVEFEGGI